MDIDKLFPSKYVRGEDIAEKGSVTVTIRGVTIEKMGKDQEENPVVWFERTDKGMVLKKTNAMTIKGLYGPDTDGWRGKRITLTTKQERAFGAMQTMIVVVNKEPATHGNVPQKISEPEQQKPQRFESWQATEYRRKVVELSNQHDSLFMVRSDVSELREILMGAERGDGGEELVVMSKDAYGALLGGIDLIVGSSNCAETILSYLLGRVIGKDTMPGLGVGELLLDDMSEDENHFADALLAVWGVIKENVKAT